MDCETTTGTNRPTHTLAGILKFKTRYHSKFLTRFWERHRRQQQQQQQQRRPQHTNSSQGTSYARLNTSQNSVISIENQNYGKSVLPKDSIQMQCLDVGSLLKMNERRDYKRLQCESLTEGTLSFAGSSLDLEWEHEYDDQEQHDDADADEARHSWFQSDDDSSSSSSEANGRSIELSQFSTPSQKLNKQNNNCCQSTTPATVTSTAQWHSRHRKRENRSRSQNRNESASRSTSMTKLEDGDNKSKRNTNWSHTSTPDSLEWDTHEDERKFKSEEDSLDRETVDLLNEIEWLKNQALIETGDTQWSSKEGDS